ncbi:MAG: hypothetical protein NC182_01110 [Prevotella sp.]|nr:hypothetical protein [Staphylococcus sp.]MCM1349782.1 hypothetical protein [Prevotella sp.]
MRKIEIGLIMVVCLFLLSSCRLNKIRYDVNEVDYYTIISTDEEVSKYDVYLYNLLIDKHNLTIYKSVEQLEESFTENKLSFNNQNIKDRYNQDFFKNKALVIFYNVDSRGGFEYKFKSLKIDNDKLVLNIIINEPEQSTTVPEPRLFFIEINEKEVKDYNEIVCEIDRNTI